MAMQASASKETDNDLTPKKSPVPVLGDGFKESTSQGIATSVENDQSQDPTKKDSSSKRRFWQLGKKKDDKSSKADMSDKDPASSSIVRSASPTPSPANEASSPQIQSASILPSSPGRAMQSSPRLHSPASSQIFERNVQEDVPVASSPAIPSHITTENHIPPVLDASSMAITDDHLTPDTVEIVTHASHQPASVTVTGTQPESTLASPIPEEMPSQIPHQVMESNEETASTYGALDSADIRRLSFISFADVVHAEHTQEGSMRDSLMLSGASSIASPNPIARSPSPVRSPVSPLSASGGGSPTFKGLGLESSPGKGGKGPGSPMASQLSGSPPIVNGELAIETMSSALKKMESGDVGAAARGSFSLNHEGAAPVS
ncbi:hypothetical protein MMC10_002215 [Thelotrema lepadinum]|nr:hypothetical protein [Thelotrema lepadinum]